MPGEGVRQILGGEGVEMKTDIVSRENMILRCDLDEKNPTIIPFQQYAYKVLLGGG